jgi:hypothetical protein
MQRMSEIRYYNYREMSRVAFTVKTLAFRKPQE